jgi:4-hydroxyproline epimerase
MNRIRIVDSHTGGEPTRVVIEGGPDLGRGSLAERRERFRTAHDQYRCGIVNEPRGSDAVVGALLCAPVDPACAAGVIFFNNAGCIGMCGHGTIGLAVTLAHLGRIAPGIHRIETPVGAVRVELHDRHRVTLDNVPSYRHAANVEVPVRGFGTVTGDVAWGGNWFFIVESPGLDIVASNVGRLTAFAPSAAREPRGGAYPRGRRRRDRPRRGVRATRRDGARRPQLRAVSGRRL